MTIFLPLLSVGFGLMNPVPSRLRIICVSGVYSAICIVQCACACAMCKLHNAMCMVQRLWFNLHSSMLRFSEIHFYQYLNKASPDSSSQVGI